MTTLTKIPNELMDKVGKLLQDIEGANLNDLSLPRTRTEFFIQAAREHLIRVRRQLIESSDDEHSKVSKNNLPKI